MSQDLRVLRQSGPAKGVDESANPRKGTVAEAFNIDTSAGTWRQRGGFNAWWPTGYAADYPARVLAEYIPDFSYAGSHYNALLIGGGRTNSWVEYIGDHTAAAVLAGHGQTKNRQQYTWVQGLWRYIEGDADVKYTSALLITNGIDPPFIYHQTSGTGALAALDAIDGLSGVTHLATAPRGRCVEIYRDRFFMANIRGEAGNRVYWSGPDSALAFPMNVWPASYNMDIGDAAEITAIKAWKEYLVIFKEGSVWVLGGDGVGGLWSVERISGEAGEGALACRAVADTGDALVFYNRRGVFMWSGGKIKNISHPRLEKTWATLDWSVYSASDGTSDRCHQAVNDPQARRVFIGASTVSYTNTRLLVYNYGNDSWDIWGGGHWNNVFSDEDHNPGGGIYGYDPAIVCQTVSFGAEVKNFLGDGPTVMWPQDGDTLLFYSPVLDYEPDVQIAASICWKIRSHPMADDEQVKLVRNLVVDAKTGDQSIIQMVVCDGETEETALRKRASLYNYITSHTNAAEHDTAGLSLFTTVANGPVDLWFVPMLIKKLSSQALLASSGNTKIKFSTTVNLSNQNNMSPGDYLVLPAGEGGVYQTSFGTVSANRVYGTATWDNAAVPDLVPVRTVTPTNVTGRKVSLLISNVGGDYGVNPGFIGDASVGHYCGVIPEIRGWELWVRPLSTNRSGASAGIDPSFNSSSDPAEVVVIPS